LRGVFHLVCDRSVWDLRSSQDGGRTEGFNLLQVRRPNQHRDEPDYEGILAQPEGFKRLQPSCKRSLSPRAVTTLALGLGSARTAALRSLAKCLVRLISVIGLKAFATGPTLALGCHFGLIFEAFPARCKRKKTEARKATAEKKEEDFSANRLKKTQWKEIQFQTGGFDPLPFHRWQDRERASQLARFMGSWTYVSNLLRGEESTKAS